MFKLYHNNSPSCLSLHIGKPQPSYNLTEGYQQVISPFKTINIMKFTKSYRGVIVWNPLLSDAIEQFTRGAFTIDTLTVIHRTEKNGDWYIYP